jgi:DNA-binding beta-propeller fold protein YncE
MYDSRRNQLYALKSSEVDVFNPATMKWGTPILPGAKGGTSYLAMTMTPDGSKLLVVDSGVNTLTIVNPDNQSQTSVASLPSRPIGIAATNTSKAFIPTGDTSWIEFDLSSLSSVARSQIFPYVGGKFVATPDGSHMVAAVVDSNGGFISAWNSADDSFNTQNMNLDFWSDVAIAPDGSRFAAIFGSHGFAGTVSGFFDEQLHYLSSTVYPDLAPPATEASLGAQFTASGKTLVIPTGDAIEFFSAATGKLVSRLMTPEPLPALYTPTNSSVNMALDQTGQTIFAISASGLTVLRLPSPADQLVPPSWPY